MHIAQLNIKTNIDTPLSFAYMHAYIIYMHTKIVFHKLFRIYSLFLYHTSTIAIDQRTVTATCIYVEAEKIFIV